MNFKLVEDFLSLATSQNFSRSAEERNVTQPAFSRRIQQLEVWVGVPLVDRSTYPTKLITQTLNKQRPKAKAKHARRSLFNSNAGDLSSVFFS